MSRLALAGTFAIFSSLLAAQSISPPFARIDIGKDSLAHIVDSTGHDTPIGKMNDQVGVDSPGLSTDRRLGGWMVLQHNCCTSYPVPTSVAIYTGKQTLYLHDEKMVVGWCFVPGRPRAVVATETVHGWTTAPDLYLYNARTGGLLRRWRGKADAVRPAWANCLKA